MFRLLLPVLVLAACSESRFSDTEDEPGFGMPPVAESPVQVDRILQVRQPQVDVLFVVDNSCSMSEEQLALGQNFPSFMDYFANSGLDFHIGVISTDMEDTVNHAGKLRAVGGRRFISDETDNPASVFSLMANMGTLGSAEERGRAAAYSMVELKSEIPRNEGFIREDAALHLVFISDEEDQSGDEPVSMTEFREWMANKKQIPDGVTAHSIVGLPGQTCFAIDTVGSQYINYATSTGGIVFNLCEPNWAPMLDQLGLIAAGLKKEYFLTRIPVTDPLLLEVHVVSDVEGRDVTRAFSTCLFEQEPECEVLYNPGRNSIVFLDYVPDPFAEVLIRYNIRELLEAT